MPVHYLQNFQGRLAAAVLLAIAGILTGPAYTSAEELPSLDDVLAQAQSSSATISSWSADLRIEATANGMEMHTKGKVMGSDGRLRSEMTMEVNGELVQITNVRGEDGVQWTELDQAGNVQVTKMDMNEIEAHLKRVEEAGGHRGAGMSKEQDPSKLLGSYTDLYDLEVTGTSAVEGAPVYIVEGPVKEELKDKLGITGTLATSGAKLGSVRITVGANDGFARKLEVLAENGDVLRTVAYKNFNTKAELDGMEFRYTPPSGVQAVDMTQQVKQMISTGGARRGH